MSEKTTEGQPLAALKEICNRIVTKHPEAVGLAMIELDCGCINLCGVSYEGEPVGSVTTITLPQETPNSETLVCLRCMQKKSRISNRIVKHGFIWPGDENETPDGDFEKFLGRKVFGSDRSD